MAARPLTKWPPQPLAQAERQLLALKEDLSALDATTASDGTTAWLSQLLVIKSAGFIEQTVLACARAHISTLATGTVRSFGLARVENYFGPKPDQLEAFVRRFDQDWAVEFQSELNADDERLRRALSQLLGDRDKIAHGMSHNVGRIKAIEHCEVAREVSRWFILRLNPLR